MTQNPVKRPDVILQNAGEETMLYRVEDTTVHVLNAPARQIWHLCDGRHSEADIAQALRKTFDVPPEFDLEGSIHRTLSELTAKGLLQTPR